MGGTWELMTFSTFLYQLLHIKNKDLKVENNAFITFIILLDFYPGMDGQVIYQFCFNAEAFQMCC